MEPLSDSSSGDSRPASTHEPLGVVIFGASGDLAARKLLPALYSLYLAGALPERSFILGVSRTVLDDDAFRARVREGIAGAGLDTGRWGAFAARVTYQALEYDDPAGYAALGERLAALEGGQGRRRRRIYYLALPPGLHGSVAAGLGRAGLAREEGGGWRRLVVEKPFGRDLASAQSLGAALLAWFPERQIFRIDHYMTKETVQNILVLRFANAIFEPLWNRMYVDHVRITASESLGVGHRAGYFEGTGVLRDMFQNHLMQLLSLVAMEPPSRFDAERVRSAQSELFRALKPLEPERVDRHLVLGQYGPGSWTTRRRRGTSRSPGSSRGPRRRRTRCCGSSSTTGAGRGCRSTSARASACAASSRGSTSSSSRCRTGCSPRECARTCGRTG